jgi:hypothetical protein
VHNKLVAKYLTYVANACTYVSEGVFRVFWREKVPFDEAYLPKRNFN